MEINSYLDLEKYGSVKNKEKCIFGAGSLGKNIGYELMKIAGIKIDFFCDNKLEENIEIIDGCRIKNPLYLRDNSSKVIVFVCMKDYQNVVGQLIRYGIKNYIIFDFKAFTKIMDSIEKADDNIKLKYIDVYDDRKYLENQFKSRMGYTLNLEKPIRFSEKLQWLKLYNRNSDYIRMVDKYAVKSYVKEIIGEKYVIPTLGIWNYFEEIEFDKLPKRFVMKCTHDSGSVILVKDKNKIEYEEFKSKLNTALKVNLYWNYREWPYKNVVPKIIVEPYLADNMVDYKFYCFNGQPQFLYVSEGLVNHSTACINYLTIDWNIAPFQRTDFKALETLPKCPSQYNEMIRICKILSKGIPFVRLDFYEINNQVYFSEYTFYPGAGFTPIMPQNYQVTIGDMLEI